MDPVFLTVATVTVIAAMLSLEAKDLVYGALALGVSLIGIAGLYVLLGAPYLAMLQIAIYVGAVVVLILFTIMLVGTEREEGLKERMRRVEFRAGLWLAGIAAIVIAGVYLAVGPIGRAQPPEGYVTVRQLGEVLTVDYGIALLILGLLITAALLGGLTLAKREEAS